MRSNQLLYKSFPDELCKAYGEAVRAEGWAEKHSGLLEFAEVALRYLTSLCLSDYRTHAPTPVKRVESHVESMRNRKPTLTPVFELLRRSVEAVSNPLLPPPMDSPEEHLIAVGRLAGASEGIEAAVEGLSRDALPSQIDVSVHIERMGQPGEGIDWWRGWEHLIGYRNKVAHAADHRWPTRAKGYWKAMTPLLHDALIGLLTHEKVERAILDHPVAEVTPVSDAGPGSYVYRVCGEERGTWFDQEVVREQPLARYWPNDDVSASGASSYILEPGPKGWIFRSLFWDLRSGMPPAVEVQIESGEKSRREAKQGRISSRPTSLEGRGSAEGTCGEFAQGLLEDGTPFHVSCPVNKSASVIAQIRPADKLSINGLNPLQRKLGLAIEYAVEEFDLGPVEVTIFHWSDLDVGKGMGSSTADVLSGIRALADAAGETLDPVAEGRLAAKVESSDGTMYPGIAAVNHKTCQLIRSWDWFPEFAIVMLVPRDCVDTPSIRFLGQEELAGEYELLLREMDNAIANRSIADFAKQSTKSAALNQRFLVNPYSRQLSQVLDDFGALGLNVGHTGTVCGLLFPNTEDGRMQASEARFAISERFGELKDVKVVTTPPCQEPGDSMKEATPD